MTIELTLRRLFSIPHLFSARKNEPGNKYHWIGQDGDNVKGTPQQTRPDKLPGGGEPNPPYRHLSSIRLGDVEDAMGRFKPQLAPAYEDWIGRNCFCQIPLKRTGDGRPPMIFGRVKSCYPSDGHLGNIENIELIFPNRDGTTDRVLLRQDDISQYSQRTVQSYLVRVLHKVTDQDLAEFEGSEHLFSANGLLPEFDSGFSDLLGLRDREGIVLPWLIVISSRWMRSMPESVYAEVAAAIKNWIHEGLHIFNYHPGRLPVEVKSLNRILGFKYGFSKTLLTEPETPQETAYIVAKIFDKVVLHQG